MHYTLHKILQFSGTYISYLISRFIKILLVHTLKFNNAHSFKNFVKSTSVKIRTDKFENLQSYINYLFKIVHSCLRISKDGSSFKFLHPLLQWCSSTGRGGILSRRQEPSTHPPTLFCWKYTICMYWKKRITFEILSKLWSSWNKIKYISNFKVQPEWHHLFSVFFFSPDIIMMDTQFVDGAVSS